MATRISLRISSNAFMDGGNIPPIYTCEGEDKNPPLDIHDYPADTKSLALIMDDPDAPGKTFDHWIVWNIKPRERIEEDTVPGEVGRNSLGENAYTGPCPPSGTHRYFFKVYALDIILDLGHSADKTAVQRAMEGHILGYGELMGRYRKQKT